jgi:hypothetical protein
MATYDIGVIVRVSWVITTSGTAVDPTTMTFSYKTDGGIPVILTMGTDAALVHDSVGHYHVDITASTSGVLSYRVDATGTNAVAAQAQMNINRNIIYV